MSEITLALEHPSLGCGEVIARYDLSEIQKKAYQQGREDAVDEFLYFVGTKLAQISIEPDVRATLYAELNIKAKELKEKNV